jgi:hypothetical protein
MRHDAAMNFLASNSSQNSLSCQAAATGLFYQYRPAVRGWAILFSQAVCLASRQSNSADDQLENPQSILILQPRHLTICELGHICVSDFFSPLRATRVSKSQPTGVILRIGL